jgi:hypothetical protein
MKKILSFFALVFVTGALSFHGARADTEDPSVQLFRRATKVFRHPRCMNCHPSGDSPTQGMDMHQHIMLVRRGTDDHGFVVMRCQSCHGSENYQNMPGNPKWALAPRSMAWQGLSDGDLCRAIKDPRKNHGMSLQQLVEHNAHDPLVGWAWNPGNGREPAPGTQEEFGKVVAEWVTTGAHCPN